MALTAQAGSDSKSALIVAVVLLLHVGVYYVIESGLSRAIIQLVAPPIDTKIIEEDKPKEDLPPPPPPPDIAEPPPFIPPPDISIAPTAAVTNAIQVVTNEAPPVAPPKPVAAPVEVPGTKAGFDPKRPVRSNQDYYPSASIRAEEEGVTTVEIYIAADGKVTDARIKNSSGFERLDNATLTYVKTWRMKPATRNGVPEGSWVTVPVRWKLEKS
jgi:periplasmic protein TonB